MIAHALGLASSVLMTRMAACASPLSLRVADEGGSDFIVRGLRRDAERCREQRQERYEACYQVHLCLLSNAIRSVPSLGLSGDAAPRFIVADQRERRANACVMRVTARLSPKGAKRD